MTQVWTVQIHLYMEFFNNKYYSTTPSTVGWIYQYRTTNTQESHTPGASYLTAGRDSTSNPCFVQKSIVYWGRGFPTDCMCVRAQLCPTLCNTMACRLLGSSVHAISQERILEWVVISFSRGSSRPRDWTLSHISCIGRHILYHYCHLGSPTDCVWLDNRV